MPELCLGCASVPEHPQACRTDPEHIIRSQLSYKTLCVCLYYCLESERCLTYLIKHEVLEQLCDTWYDWICKINDTYAQNRNWGEKHKNILREWRPNTWQLRTDWTLRWNLIKISQMYLNIRLAFYATMAHRWHFKR